MARTEIRGGQIKDDSITGDDVDESTLVLDTLRDADGDTKVQIEESADEDKIRFDTAGSERMIITNAGLVGIGTNDPDNTLHVKSLGNTHLKVESEDGSYAALKLKSGTGGSTYVWTPANTSDIRLYAGGADRVHVDNDGSVGIGTTGPDRKLDILDASNPQLRLTQADGTKYVELKGTTAGDLEISGVSSDTNHSHLKWSAAGNAAMIIQSNAADGDAELGFSVDAGSSLAFSLGVDDGDSDKFKIGTSTIGTNTRLTIDNSGKVGIGTTTPGSGLHVADSISLPIGSLRTSAYSIAEDDFCIVADCNSSAFTLTLPSATDAMAGRIYTIKRMDSGNSGGGNMLTISRNGKNIDNIAGDVVLANLDALVLQCIGTNGGWIRIGSFLAPI